MFLLVARILFWMHSANSSSAFAGLEEYTIAPQSPPAALLMVLLSALAVHMPSILWARRVHALKAITLLERMVYYCMAQMASLVLLGILLPHEDYSSLQWTVCGYFVMYFCGHVSAALAALTNSTLSDTALHAAVLFAAATLAPTIALRSIAPEQSAIFRNHAVACLIADAVKLLCTRLS